MPRHSDKVPAYCLHNPSGQAVVYFDRKPNYLGQYGSADSHENYEREIAQWRERRRVVAAELAQSPPGNFNSLTISEMILAYVKFAGNYYVTSTGEQTKEFIEMKLALRSLRKLFGSTLVRNFGPLALKAIRTHMVDGGRLSRMVINRRVNRIRRVFKWAVSEELAPPGTYEALRSVEALKAGRTRAHENEPVKPVPEALVDAVVAAAHPVVAAMIRMQMLGGMRPCEVVSMRACDIDMTGDVWLYQPYDHKNRWRGKDRAPILLGPLAQEILRPFLNRDGTAFLFCPIVAESRRNEQRRAERITPMTPSQRKRRPKKQPKRPKRDRYDTNSYRRAITYTIARINRERVKRGEVELPHWCPLQLRHSRGTEIRKKYGIEAAQVFLGHERADVTQVYAERNLEQGVRIALEIG